MFKLLSVRSVKCIGFMVVTRPKMRTNPARAGAKAVDLGGPSVYQGGQSFKLSTKAAVFKRVSLFIGGPGPPFRAGTEPCSCSS